MGENKTPENEKIIDALKNDKIVVQIYIPASMMNKVIECKNSSQNDNPKNKNDVMEELVAHIKTELKNELFDRIIKMEQMNRDLKAQYYEILSNQNLILNVCLVFGSILIVFSLLTFILLLVK